MSIETDRHLWTRGNRIYSWQRGIPQHFTFWEGCLSVGSSSRHLGLLANFGKFASDTTDVSYVRAGSQNPAVNRFGIRFLTCLLFSEVLRLIDLEIHVSWQAFFATFHIKDCCLLKQRPDLRGKSEALLPVTHGSHSVLGSCWWAKCLPGGLGCVGVLLHLPYPHVASEFSQASAISVFILSSPGTYCCSAANMFESITGRQDLLCS